MQAISKVFGWILLVVGVLVTAPNLAFVLFGLPRLGILIFGANLVIVGLWLARPGKKKGHHTQ